mgnify:CR=1 FL=1
MHAVLRLRANHALFPGREIDRANAPVVGRHYISADYFRALGIRAVLGRGLHAGRSSRRAAGRDRQRISRAALLARARTPSVSTSGLARCRRSRIPSQPVEIVGVVDDVKYDNVETSLPQFYTSFLQFSWPDTMVIVKAQGNPIDLVPSLRAAVADGRSGAADL